MVAFAKAHPMVVKTASYSIMHMVVAIAVAYVLSGNILIALGIGLIEPLVQTVAYHLHEKTWQRILRRTAT